MPLQYSLLKNLYKDDSSLKENLTLIVKDFYDTGKDITTLKTLEVLEGQADAVSFSAMELLSEMHYEENISAMEAYLTEHSDNRYLEVQDDMNTIKFGVDLIPEIELKLVHTEELTAAGNACEVIAAYNALESTGAFYGMDKAEKAEYFCNMLKTFERNGVIVGGNFGTSPVDICEYFNDLDGYEATMYTGTAIEEDGLAYDSADDYNTFIITAWNKTGDITCGIHTVSITKEPDGYVIHNDKSNPGTVFGSLEEAVDAFGYGDNDPISLIGIKRNSGIEISDGLTKS